jgi:hypothetical protein
MHAQIDIEIFHAACGGNTGWAWAGLDTSQFGTGPFTWLWSPEPGSGQGTEYATGLGPGDYTLTVTDSQGNITQQQFTIIALPGLNAPGGLIDTVITCNYDCIGTRNLYYSNDGLGGVGPYSGSTDAPGATIFVSNYEIWAYDLCAGGPYTIDISDSQGCTSTYTIGEVVLLQPELELLDMEVTPSCPNGSSGTISLTFDSPTNVYGGPLVSGSGSDQYLFTELPPGIYDLTFMSPDWTCYDSTSMPIEVPASMDGCGTIMGTVYADLNGDCVQQIDEPGLPLRTIAITTDPQEFVLTDANGNYTRDRLFGQHEMTFADPDFSPGCPGAMPIGFELTQTDPIVTQDIAMQYDLGSPDAYVHMATSAPRIGDSTVVWITVNNDSPYSIPASSIDLTHSDIFTFSSATITPASIGSTQIEWQVPELEPFTDWQVSVRFTVPLDVTLIGMPVGYFAQLVQTIPDIDPMNDSYDVQVQIVSAYDPNDKLARSGPHTWYFEDQFYFLSDHEHVDFTIRFQNTGNAAAEHVYILDTISTVFDAESFQVLGSSHDMIPQWQVGRILRFDLPEIMLPDSASDPIASQGFVSFRLRPVSSIQYYDTLSNTSDIFFDMNPGIRTNTAQLIVSWWESVPERWINTFQVIPNPTVSSIRITGTDLTNATWQIHSVDGRSHLTGRSNSYDPKIDVSSLAPGQYIITVISDQANHRASFIKQ